MTQLSNLIKGAVATTVSTLANGATLNTPASGNFSSGTFTWPTFNQSTLGSAASLSTVLPLSLGGTGSTTAADARTALGAASSANPTFTGSVTLPSGTYAPGLLGSVSNSVTALGTNQAGAAALVSDINIITSAAAGTGVVVPGATSGKYAVIVNRSANAVNIYPAAGHAFDGQGTNAPISLLPYAFIELFGTSSTQWHTSYQALTQGQFVVGNISGNAAGLTSTLAVTGGGTGTTTSTGNGSVVLSTSPTLVTPVLGTPTSVTLTNATGLPLTTGVTGTLPVASGGTGVTTSTGSGANVLSTSPTLVSPALGTPTALVGTNITGTAAGLSIGGNAATATTATNIAGGSLGDLAYQTGSSTTGFISFSSATPGQALIAGRGSPYWGTVSVPAAGSNTEIQYNSSGSFAASSLFSLNLPAQRVFIGNSSNAMGLQIYGDGTYTGVPFQANDITSTLPPFMMTFDTTNAVQYFGNPLQKTFYSPPLGQAGFEMFGTKVFTVDNSGGIGVSNGVGGSGQVLTSSGPGYPAYWATPSGSSTATNISGGSFGDLVYQTGSSSTGFISFSTATSGQALIAGMGAPYWGTPANATTATNVSGGTASVTTLTASSAVTLSGGTANGVAYLNGSNVVTTGSALTFNGSTLTAPTLVGNTFNNFTFTAPAGTTSTLTSAISSGATLTATGASSPTGYGVVSNPKATVVSTGGAGSPALIGSYNSPTIISSDAGSVLFIYGSQNAARRGSSTDLGSASGSALYGTISNAGHVAGLPATAFTSTITGVSAAAAVPAGTAGTVTSITTNLTLAGAAGQTTTVTAAYGHQHLATIGNATGTAFTVGSYYGMYLGAPTVGANATITNRYGIYQADTAATNYIGGTLNVTGALTQNSNQVLHAANYNSYSPTLTGTGASGTWGISITGNAATATSSPKLSTSDLRSTSITPGYFTQGLNTAFMSNTTDSLSDGGSYHGILQFQQWSDASGGGAHQLGFTDNNNIWHRGSSGALTTWSTWYKFLDSGNFNSYAVPLSGGTMTGQLNLIGSTNVVPLIVRSSANNYSGYYQYTNTASSTGTSILSNGNYTYIGTGTYYLNGTWTYPNQVSGASLLGLSETTGAAWWSGTGASYANVANQATLWNASGVWTGSLNAASGAQVNSSTILTAANYNSYSPTLTGTGASGTWGINVTGNAATATTATNQSGGTVNATTGTFTPNASGVSTGLNVVNGDITTYRSGGTSGVIYFGTSGGKYLYYDGTNYSMPGGQLDVNGSRVLNAANYNSYSPTLTGTGASGTWGITVTGNAANVTGTVSVANGGTGLTTAPANGALDIGNGTGFTRTTLTAGSGVSITNSSGGITISATGSGGTITSVTATAPVSSTGGTTPVISLASGYGDTQNPYASKTANYFLAAPNGSAAAPTFRAIVAADIPTLNQSTTGTAANITATSNSTLTTLSVLSLPGSQVSGNISGNAANVTGVVAVANGGTGLTSTPANGVLDIGNGTGFTRTSLTAGSNITITKASGSITIATSSVGAQAWVKFNLGPTPTISASYNVSSITYNSASVYTINFSTQFTNTITDANYIVVASAQTAGGNKALGFGQYSSTTPTTSSCQMKYYDSTFGQVDPNVYGYVAIFR